jgi:hypothetical protein
MSQVSVAKIRVITHIVIEIYLTLPEKRICFKIMDRSCILFIVIIGCPKITERSSNEQTLMFILLDVEHNVHLEATLTKLICFQVMLCFK